MKSHHWEIFRGGQTMPRNKHLSATINRKHVLLLNRYTYNTLGTPEAVLLMYDSLQRTIGVSPTRAGDPDGFTVKLKNGLNYIVHTAPFCRYHGILIEATERFVEPGLTREGYLTLDLKNTVNVSNRRKGNKL